ncbi:Mur ligase family protein [Bacillus norwichensis]|uniref:UDP-N-acetylmuramoyl-tripeptide--D-alanyl-D-alanine ligase n=1 Tax=Bacillus norwichensis TaxID=2762217 RepID=A0ABR8VS90_9BACI|nr:UDP-N-acetylmuramoyl-tripeptide--D-alanyl-D-alanine ligase [Bacillus norwichensis]MBD8007637.1 UDP-N-acetylmuramoyl-tripeptide--D-alanyl-D-alanine ligase [Bacillus norwichensis]
MTAGFTYEELNEILDGYYFTDISLARTIIDFEIDPTHLSNKEGNCFISISNKRWNEVHRRNTDWKDGNDKILLFYQNCDLIITEEPIQQLKNDVPQLIVKDSYKVMKLLAQAARQKMQNPVIGITGSVGKSSTRLMFEHLLKDTHSIVATRGNHNTQTGVPLYGAKLCQNPDIGILEISLNALNNRGNQSLTISPNVCIVTSIGEAHLSTLHSLETVAQFKARIFDGLEANGLAIINKDIQPEAFQILLKRAAKRTGRIKTYSLKSDASDLYLKKVVHSKYKSTIVFHYKNKDYQFDMQMPSEGTIMNSLGTFLCLAEMGFEVENLLSKMFHFQSLNKVMELKQLTTIDNRNIDIIDDSHNAAIPSMMNAIETFKAKQSFYRGNKILILGQVADLGGQSSRLHEGLIPHVLSSGADFVFGHGHYMRKVIQKLPAHMVGGWFDNALHLSKHVPFYCTDDSLIVLKGSVSGSDFRKISHLLPLQIKRSKQALKDFSPNSIAEVLQPMWGAAGHDLKSKQEIFSIGYPSSQGIEGIAPVLLLMILLKKGIQFQEVTNLKNWPTNNGESIGNQPFKTGEKFSHRELVEELIQTQHPSAIFELVNIYCGSRRSAMEKILKASQSLKITPAATLNLSGRYRVKEQQAFNLHDLFIVGEQLFEFQSYLPTLFAVDGNEVKGIVFGNVRYSCIAFVDNIMICMIGMRSRDKLLLLLSQSLHKLKSNPIS